MKNPGFIAASVAAASATAISVSSSSKTKDAYRRKSKENSTTQGSSPSDKFAPRFDGLRFIETLVTAHR